MDGDRFDTLTRRLATPPTRRRVIKALGGALAGALLGGRVAAADGCKAGGKACKKDSQCCSGYCQGATAIKSNSRNGGVCCIGAGGIANGESCAADDDCCSGICQAGTCVATLAGTCSPGANNCTVENGVPCGNGACNCFQGVEGDTVCGNLVGAICGDCISSGCPDEQICVRDAAGCCSGLFNTACVPLCPPSGGGCFTGETRIALADGTSKPIALVAVGDQVLGRDGVNRVLAVDRPLLGGQPLYAFNGGTAFVTANHPFLTATGWTAIDPAAAMATRPAVAVRRLAVGERLLALAGVPVLAGGPTAGDRGAPQVAAMAVEGLAAAVADPATPLFDLRVDGDHTYFANDLLVHNK